MASGHRRSSQERESPQFEEFAAQATRRLTILRDATCLQDLQSLPSNHFHALSGKLRGKYAIRVNARLRVVFGWDGEGAIDVEIIDYH
ncbi:MAG: type II toxin-antitoxin system RelE/ParE family toxin [Pseudomonadota bacterium]